MKLLELDQINKLGAEEVLNIYKTIYEDNNEHLIPMSPVNLQKLLDFLERIKIPEDELITHESFINESKIAVLLLDLRQYIKELEEDISLKPSLKMGVFDAINDYIKRAKLKFKHWDEYIGYIREGGMLADCFTFRHKANIYMNVIKERYNTIVQEIEKGKAIGFTKGEEKKKANWEKLRKIQKEIIKKDVEAQGGVYVDADLTEEEQREYLENLTK